jgi:hypothetical protein
MFASQVVSTLRAVGEDEACDELHREGERWLRDSDALSDDRVQPERVL